MLAKVVTKSRPIMVPSGNSWASDIVYMRDGMYYTREIIAPDLKHGPFEIGEEVEIEPSFKDRLAEGYMTLIYDNPDSYKEVMEQRKIYLENNPYTEKESHKTRKTSNVCKKTPILDAVIVISLLFVLGSFLFILIAG